MLDLLPPTAATQSRRWLRRLAGQRTSAITLQPGHARELRTTPAADTSLAEAARLAGQSPVGSHHILLASLTDTDSAAARALAGLGVDLDRVREALRSADVTGSTDELPEEAGRRQMLVTVKGDRLTVDASDPAIVALARATLDALGARSAGKRSPSAGAGAAYPEGVIRGDDPLGASLSLIWQAMHDSLEDIRSRAAAADVAPPTPPGESDAADG
ncbi:MAG TPA: Clp protease N-terminal domain-containing protein [Streptosporangiaceae bacterium]